jgi:DNA topoisomerase IB
LAPFQGQMLEATCGALGPSGGWFSALQVENVTCEEGNHIKFDFLGKDSIRYENTVEVHPTVYKNVQSFLAKDSKGKGKRRTMLSFVLT